MKRQIWLQPEQHELLINCIHFAKEKLGTEYVIGDAHKMAGKFVSPRLDDLLKLLTGTQAERNKP